MFKKIGNSINYFITIIKIFKKRIISDIWDTLTPGGHLVYSTCTALMRSRVRSWILGAIPRATYALNWRPSMYTSTEDTSTPAWVASASAMALRSCAASSGST